MKPPAKLLLLAIDAASPDLLDRWIANQSLPNLAALAQRGTTGRTQGVDGFFIGSTWPSFYTGQSPATHGIHYGTQLTTGTYTFHRSVETRASALTPFWKRLSDAGQRIAVLDVPLTALDHGINGLQVVEWGGHDAVFGFDATPAAARREIASRFGSHPLGASCDAIRRSPADYASFVETLIRAVQKKAELTRHFLRRGGFDFFMQVFTEAHCAGHQCWHLHDVSHPAHDADTVRVTGDPLHRVYTAIDAAIGAILEVAGDANVVVLSAHGMAHWFGAQFLLPEILYRLGAAHPSPPSQTRDRGVLHRGARAAWRHLPPGVRTRLEPLRARVSDEQSADALPTIGVDPSRSRCFIVPNGFTHGAIRLNLRGREPEGILEPGRAANDFCDDLERALLDLTDERTGGPLVRRVIRTARLYTGERLHHLPDLLVEWCDDVPTGSTAVGGGAGATVRVHSPRIGSLEGANHYGRTGEHRAEGWYVAAGLGAAPGRLTDWGQVFLFDRLGLTQAPM